jgi:hypothetical protein
MSGEVIQTMADEYGKKLLSDNNSTINSTDFNSQILQYKVFVGSSLSFFVGVIQILMVSSKTIFKNIFLYFLKDIILF